MGLSLKSCSVFYLSLYHLLSNQVAFTSSRLADRRSPGRALLDPWTANGRQTSADGLISAILAPQGKYCGPSVTLGLNSCLLCLAAILCQHVKSCNLEIKTEFLTCPFKNIICCYRKRGLFNLNEKSVRPQGKNTLCTVCTESLSTWILSVKLILIDDDSLPISPTTIQIQHSAMGCKTAVTLTWPSP